MANLPDEDLILHFYGEHPSPAELERALAADPGLARRYEAMRRELVALGALEPPAPRDGLEGRIWTRVDHDLRRVARSPWEALFTLRLAAMAAIALVLFISGIFFGRKSFVATPTETATREPGTASDRVLADALGNHLASTERLLVSLTNDADPALSDERRFASALLDSNRLYRRAAERAGHRRIASLLAELEPVLAEIAHAPAGDGVDDLDAARERSETRDLLFKIRVTRRNI